MEGAAFELCVSQRIPGPPEGSAALLPVAGAGWGPHAVKRPFL